MNVVLKYQKQNNDRLGQWLFVFILVVALILRVWGETACGIWYDEVFTIKMATKSWSELPDFIAQDVHPGGYYYLVRLFLCFTRLFPLGAWSLTLLRLSSLLPGMLILWIVALWGWRRWGCGAGLTLCLAGALNSGLIYYSIELRAYAWGMLLVLVSTLLLNAALEVPSRTAWLKFGLCCLCLMQTHYLTWLIIVAQMGFVVCIMLRRSARARMYLWPCLVFLLPLTTIIQQAPQALRKHSLYYQPNSAYFHQTILSDGWTVFSYDFPGMAYGQGAFGCYGLMIQGLCAAFYGALIGFLLCRRQAKRRSQCGSLMSSLLLFTIISFIGSVWMISLIPWPNINPGWATVRLFSGYRTAMLVLPLWLMLLSMGIECGVAGRAKLVLRAGLVALMVPGCIWGLWQRYCQLDDFRTLSERIEHPTANAAFPLRRLFLVEDQDLFPWLKAIGRNVELRSLDEQLVDIAAGQNFLQIMTHTASDLHLRNQHDQRRVDYIREWMRSHHNPVEQVGVMEISILPAAQYAAFRAGMPDN